MEEPGEKPLQVLLNAAARLLHVQPLMNGLNELLTKSRQQSFAEGVHLFDRARALWVLGGLADEVFNDLLKANVVDVLGSDRLKRVSVGVGAGIGDGAAVGSCCRCCTVGSCSWLLLL